MFHRAHSMRPPLAKDSLDFSPRSGGLHFLSGTIRLDMKSLRKKKYQIEIKSKDLIEPEEIFLDSKKEEKEIVEGKVEVPLRESVFRLLSLSLGVLFLGLTIRLFSLQVLHHPDYTEAARQNALRIRAIQAPRGVIYDRHGKVLAENIPQIDVSLDVVQARRGGYLESDIAFLNSVLTGHPGFETLRIDDLLARESLGVVRIVSRLEQARIGTLRERDEKERSSGIRVEEVYRRKYLDPEAFSHLVGYTGFVSKKELESRSELFLHDISGKAGVEASYDTILRGVNGIVTTTIDSRGNIEQETKSRDPEGGTPLTLTIDADLQVKLYDTLLAYAKQAGSGKGAAIAVDPRDGAVLALVSVPGFDTDLLSSGPTPDELRDITENSNKPLFNRVLSGTYPPGSTIKPFIALAVLEENLISPLRKIYAASSITVPNKYDSSITYTFPDWKEHGLVNMIQAIAVSSNVYFYHVGGGYGNIPGLGIEKIKSYLELFGFGPRLEIDLPGESAGIIPTPQWKVETKGEKWYIGDTYHASIGQGDILVTPLQLCLAISIFANDGELWKPHVVLKKGEEAQISASLVRASLGKEADRDIVRQGLREAVLSGSSKLLRDLPVEVAGKTGTAEPGGGKTPHAWWSGFAPYQDPEIVLTILIENGGEGSSVAVPVAKEVLGWYFSRH